MDSVTTAWNASEDDESLEPPFENEHDDNEESDSDYEHDHEHDHGRSTTQAAKSATGTVPALRKSKRRSFRRRQRPITSATATATSMLAGVLPPPPAAVFSSVSTTSDPLTEGSFDEDTVTGNWSLEEEEEEDSANGSSDPLSTSASARRQRQERRSGSRRNNSSNSNNRPSVTIMSQEDIAICQRLDEEYDRALEERQVGYTARYNSVRQSACFAVGFMSVYLTLGTVFFMRQAGWDVADSLLFSIYTITTVGYGNLEYPDTPLFQLYTIFFIFIGIATLTIMVAQVYQCIALEASRAQHSRDNSEMARRGLEILMKSEQDRRQGGSRSAANTAQRQNNDNNTSDDIMMSISIQAAMIDQLFHFWERAKVFLRDSEFGRGLSVLFPFAGLITIGAAVIGSIEGWTVVESLYFSVVSLTTVGFGDYFPTRTASVWFTILWLPFSVGFMSLFLGNVAAFYIRLSDQNIARIERHLRRRIQRAKERAEKEREEALRRAMRGQQYAASIEMGNIETSSQQASEGSSGEPRPKATLKRRNGFDTIPMVDDPETAVSPSPRASRKLFGSPENTGSLLKSRRDRIMMNSISERSAGSTEPRSQESIMRSMKEILRAVHGNNSDSEGGSDSFRSSAPEDKFLSIRSSTVKVDHHSLRHDHIRKPSFALRVLVQERFSEIIATDIAGYQSSIEIKENTLSVTIDTLKGTADKWLVPRRARKAFRAVAFEALYFVGEHGLITRGADALYDLSPFEFHGLFSPLLAALADAETMEVWLASTEVLAEVDLRRDSSRPSLAQFRKGDQKVSAKTASAVGRATRAVGSNTDGRGRRVTEGDAFRNR